jgi:hypothetical protein
MFAIRLVAISAAFLLFGFFPPVTAQSYAPSNAPKAAIERYLEATRQHRSSRTVSWISPQLAKTKELVYVSSLTSLSIYSSTGQLLGVIAVTYGGNFGYGIAVDAQENVYAGALLPQSQQVIYEYARGATEPKRTMLLSNSSGGFSQGIAVDKAGTVYAAQPYVNQIAVFAAGSNSPTRRLTIPPNNESPFSLTIDSNGTLLALVGEYPNFPAAIVEYPHGKGPGFIGPYQLGGVGEFGIAADSTNHIVVTSGASDPPSCYVFLRNDPVPIQSGGPGAVGFLAFNRKSDRLYYGSVYGTNGPAGVLTYPGLRSLRTIQTTENFGIAVSPAVNV